MSGRCLRCYKSNCLCEDILQVDSPVEVTILQHPDERTHPLGSAKIVELSLPGTKVWIEKDFAHHQPLNELITSTRKTLLLYPSESAFVADSWANDNLSPSHPIRQEQLSKLSIIIIDGTWRKAKKIFQTTPLLQTIPAVKLATQVSSAYTLRKAQQAYQLSTLESTVQLLNILDRPIDSRVSPEVNLVASSENNKFNTLLIPFNKMIERQIAHMGNEKYTRNYQQD